MDIGAFDTGPASKFVTELRPASVSFPFGRLPPLNRGADCGTIHGYSRLCAINPLKRPSMRRKGLRQQHFANGNRAPTGAPCKGPGATKAAILRFGPGEAEMFQRVLGAFFIKLPALADVAVAQNMDHVLEARVEWTSSPVARAAAGMAVAGSGRRCGR